MPDLGRDLPIAFIVGFLALAMAVARKRRAAQTAQRQGGGMAGGTPPGTGHLTALAPSVQRSLSAALHGVEGRLARALRRTPSAVTSGGARAAHVMAVLEQVSLEIGLPYSLAGATRLLVEGAETMELVVEAPRLPTARLDAAVGHLATKLGVAASAASSVERDGLPLITLTVKSAHMAAPAEVRPHPAPLLVPLGTTASGAVLHLHVGRTGGLLVGGGGQSLVATLLAGIVYQAPPDALRLLVASDDDELRKALPQLEHLDAPPADARDPRAVANLIAQAYTLVLERYERHGAATTAASAAPAAPAAPCLLVLAGLESLDDEALDRLDAVAHTGPVCGVHLIATTGDPAALAANGLLALFRTRLARRLAPEESRLLCPDADVDLTPNAPHEVLLHGLGAPRKLTAFTLTPPEVREVFATVAAATLPPLPAFMPPPVPAPPPATPSPGPVDAVLGASDGRDDADASPGADAVVDDVDDGDDGDGNAVSPSASDPSVTAMPGGPLVRIDLLGGITVCVHGQPINILPRERSLLTALAVMGPRPVRRPDLIEALFSDEADGGNTLSHALSDLRAALRKGGLSREQAGSVVLKTGGGYHLHPDLVEVDLWQFDALLREAEGLDEAEAGPVRARAFALYHGGLCGGEALDFLEEHSYRWMKRVGPAMYSLADHYRDAGDLKSALHWTRRLLADEPCDDHANQLLLNLLADAGDAEGLDAHMQQMREHFAANKLKVDAYTVRLYEQLRRKLAGEATTKAG